MIYSESVHGFDKIFHGLVIQYHQKQAVELIDAGEIFPDNPTIRL